MIIGLGIDVVELDRIARAMTRFGNRFLGKVLTAGELAVKPAHAVPFVAARFAAKEAAAKALGTGFSAGVSLTTIEVVGGERGKPGLALHAAAMEAFRRLGGRRMHLSLTHGRDVAAAVVVFED
jgi:holo-[acyl-carrier protein] synthase